MKHIPPYTFLLLCFLFLFSCTDQSKEVETSQTVADEGPHVDYFNERTEKMKKFLSSKKINSLDEVLGKETDQSDKYLIFYVTGQDCGSCISKGFNGIKELEQKLKEKIYPIGSNVNIGNMQLYYDYQSAIYPDNRDLIRKELGYFHSPMFLWYSPDKGIEDIYFIPTFQDGNKMNDFFESID